MCDAHKITGFYFETIKLRECYGISRSSRDYSVLSQIFQKYVPTRFSIVKYWFSTVQYLGSREGPWLIMCFHNKM